MKRAASSTTGASAEEEYGKSESDPLIDSNNKQAHTVRRSRWYHTSFVIMAEVMGAGILGLPYATVRLGLVLGVVTSVCCGLAAWYAGWLLSRVKHEFSCTSDAESYAGMAAALVGPLFGSFTKGIIAFSWAMMTTNQRLRLEE